MKVEVLAQPDGSSVGERLIAELEDGGWDGFRCCVAFAKISGVRYLDPPLRRFIGRGGWSELSVGVDSSGTSFEALSQLAASVDERGRLIVVRDPASPAVSFHPKIYAFIKGRREKPDRTLAIVGSSNITLGGLFSNHEASLAVDAEQSNSAENRIIGRIMTQLDQWCDETSPSSVTGDSAGLLRLHRDGQLPTELQIAKRQRGTHATVAQGRRRYRGRPVPSPPREAMGPPLVVLSQPAGQASARRSAVPTAASTHLAFFIDVVKANKTEIHLSKAALDVDPSFFGHPFTGRTEPRRGTPQPKREPSPIADIRLLDSRGTTVAEYPEHTLTMWHYTPKQELRITIPRPLLEQLPDSCLLEMRRWPVRSGVDYSLDFLTSGSDHWEHARLRATEALQSSERRMGWE